VWAVVSKGAIHRPHLHLALEVKISMSCIKKYVRPERNAVFSAY